MSMRTCVTILLVIPVRSAQLTVTENSASRIKGIAQEHSLVPNQDKQCKQCLWKIPRSYKGTGNLCMCQRDFVTTQCNNFNRPVVAMRMSFEIITR